MRSYSERLRVPVSWWLLAIVCVAILGAEVFAGFGGFVPLLVYGLLGAIVVAFLVAWGAATITVEDGALQAGGARLELAHTGEVTALDDRQSARMRGPRGDPTARMYGRPYLKRAVYVAITDPASPHPYWLIGTRHPEQLAAAIEASREPVTQPSVQ
jgi:hypothetical protein